MRKTIDNLENSQKFTKRRIIEIDENKCNGCAACTKICAEAALQMVNGKAKLVKDFYCDGMGACLDVCPVNALKIVEKETQAYYPQKAYEYVKEIKGEEAALNIHNIEKVKTIKENTNQEPKMQCGCPSSMIKDFRETKANSQTQFTTFQQPTQNQLTQSELKQWPVQLKLLQPHAPYFQNSDLLIAADCVPFTYPNFHQKFLTNKTLAILCPKLDSNINEYIDKLKTIFETQNIKSITIVKMEVPCCSAVEKIVKQALQLSKKNIIIKEYTISIRGKLINNWH